MNFTSAIVWILLFFLIYGIVKYWKAKKNDSKLRTELLAKYGDIRIAETIMCGVLCDEMTSEQVIDMWGAPKAVEHKPCFGQSAEYWRYVSNSKKMEEFDVIFVSGLSVGCKKVERNIIE